MTAPPGSPGQPAVLAVVVSSGVTAYLPQTLQGIAAQETPPEAVLVVDVTTGSNPGHARTSALRTAAQEAGLALERVRVTHAPAARTFGEGAREGLRLLSEQGAGGAQLARSRWLWLLHDDSAPMPDALEELLRIAKSGPTIAITGAKQRDWDHPEHLLELGVTVSTTGRRFLGLEDGELDQGQHDARLDVYGVGTAGALVLSSVWDELGGPDPELGPFGDGLDLARRARLAGYRVVVAPRAVVRHARAGYRGLRAPAGDASSTPDVRRSYRARRTALLYARLVEAPRWALPLLPLAVVLSTVAHVIARLATKEFRLAGDEIAAAAALSRRGRAVVRARRRAHRGQRIPARHLKPLRAGVREASRAARDRRLQAAAARRHLVVPSELELAERAELAARRRWTITAVVGGLAVLAAVTLVPLTTAGALTGGALLPLRSDVGALWQRVVGAWSPTADGYPAPADPFLAVVTVLSVLTGGSGRAATTLLVLGALPLAGVGAWFAAGAVTRSVRLRAWSSIAWATAPPLLLATGHGRLGPLVAHLVLPWAALGVARALGVQRRDELVGVPTAPAPPRTASVAAAAGAGLGLAVAAAGAPVLLPTTLLGLLLLALVVRRRRAVLALVAVPPLVLLAPLLVEAAADPAAGSWRLLLAEPGVPLAAEPGASYLAVLGWPVQPLPWPVLPQPAATVAPLVASGVVVLGAVAAVVRRGRLRVVRGGWCVLVVGLAAALLAPRVPVAVAPADLISGEAGGQVVHGWGGAGTSVVVLGALIAVVGAADGIIGRLASSSFGWRQIGAAGLAVLLVLAPVAAAVAWGWELVEARRDPAADPLLALAGRGPDPVPALGAELQRSPQNARVLALDAVGDDVVARLWRSDGDQLDERSAVVAARVLTGPPGSELPERPDDADTHLAQLVAGLAVGSGADPSEQLARHAIGVVVVPPGAGDGRERLVAGIDATPGLERVTENATGTVWRVATEAGVGRVRVVGPDGEVRGIIPSDGVVARGDVPDWEAGRLVVLAERAAPGWRAWLDGRPLRSRTLGWEQAFALPAQGGRLSVTYVSWPLTLLHSAQAVVLGTFAVLALPLRRRRAGAS